MKISVRLGSQTHYRIFPNLITTVKNLEYSYSPVEDGYFLFSLDEELGTLDVSNGAVQASAAINIIGRDSFKKLITNYILYGNRRIPRRGTISTLIRNTYLGDTSEGRLYWEDIYSRLKSNNL